MADGAIFHLDVSTVSRSQGRSSVAAAAYRAGQKLFDGRTGLCHDYKRKQGVLETFIAAPDGCDWITDRNTLWDSVETAEKRKNSTVAREWLVALPDALEADQRTDLTRALAAELVTRYGVAVDVAIHAPSKGGDQRNHHAHLLTTTRQAGPNGLGAKTRILDAAKTGGVEIANMREWWAGMVNDALGAAQSPARIDHRRKSVIAAEIEVKAETLYQKARAIDVMNLTPAEMGGIWKGLGHATRAIRSGGLAVFTSSTSKAVEIRQQAIVLFDRAADLRRAPNTHNGPKLTAYKRRMAPQWAHEQQRAQETREVALRASEAAAERQREARRIAEAQKVLQDREAAIRAQESRAQQARQRELAAQNLADQREANFQTFKEKQLQRADSFPTPSQRWLFPRFPLLEPESLQLTFVSKYRSKLTPDEITETICGMLKRWVDRIVEDLPPLKPMTSIWTAMTGGNINAGAALKKALTDHPDLAEPLKPAIEDHKAKQEPEKPTAPKVKPKPPGTSFSP